MRKSITILFLSLIISCSNKPSYKYSEAETEQFLRDITENIKVSITDITELEKKATNIFTILTRYPISQKELDKYNKNNSAPNKDDDISDFATYIFKNYELINEKGEKLQLVDNGRAVYLQESSFWEYGGVLCQNLTINMRLNKNYEKLKGYIVIEFEMPGKFIEGKKKEIKIPVDISIYDIVPE